MVNSENKIKPKKQTLSRIQASEKEIEKLEAEIMFCLIKNPKLIEDFRAQLIDLDFRDEFFKNRFGRSSMNSLLAQLIFFKAVLC